MTERVVAVLARAGPAAGAPPGIDPERFAVAMLDDVLELVADLAAVTPAVVICDGPVSWRTAVEGLVWPGTRCIALPPTVPVPPDGAGGGAALAPAPGVELAAFAALVDAGADAAVLVVPDAPDLPGLLVGKLFRGLAHADVAVCPSADGALVALAARLPVPPWLSASGVGLDSAGAVAELYAAAPRRTAVFVGPGWHRVRAPADVGRLDPGLEGWAATRALLSGTVPSGGSVG